MLIGFMKIILKIVDKGVFGRKSVKIEISRSVMVSLGV